MNRILAGLAIAGAIAAAQTPDARADYRTDYLGEQQYVADLSTAGVPAGTAAQETYVGELICAHLADGLSTTEVALRMINGAGATRDEATAIVGLAVIDICPQYAPVPLNHTPAPVPVTIASAIAGGLA